MSAPILRTNPFDHYVPFSPQAKSIVNVAKLEECIAADTVEYSTEELKILLQAQDAWIKEYRAKMFNNVFKNELNLPERRK